MIQCLPAILLDWTLVLGQNGFDAIVVQVEHLQGWEMLLSNWKRWIVRLQKENNPDKDFLSTSQFSPLWMI